MARWSILPFSTSRSAEIPSIGTCLTLPTSRLLPALRPCCMIHSWGYPPQKRPDPGRYEPFRLKACRCGSVCAQSLGTRVILDRKSAMRDTEAGGWMVWSASSATMRALRLAVVPLGVTLVVTTGAARAGDDQQDDRSFTERFVDSFKSTIRGTNMDNRGIDYRERSPLVVPPKLDLPPPAASTNDVKVANWPKDPDERQRKAVIAAKKKNAPPAARVQAPEATAAPAPGTTGSVATARPINIAPPPEDPPIPGTTRPAYANDRNGTARIDPVYDQPGDLLKGGASALSSSSFGETLGLNNLFGSKKADT